MFEKQILQTLALYFSANSDRNFPLVKKGMVTAVIIYDKLWVTMKKKGISTYRLRENHGFNTKTIAKLRQNGNITTATLNKLCSILDCDISEISEYRKD